MKKIWLILATALLLTACGSNNTEEVNVYNWGEYIDRQIIEQFEEETGITVKYDTYVTNEDLYVKMKQGNAGFDVVVPSDYMIEKMIAEDLLDTLDFDKIPNYSHIDPTLTKKSYDPEEQYSVPYFWGTVGIVYNKTMVDKPIDSWDVLWDPAYENQIIMLDSSRDSIGIALIRLGYSINTTDERELEQAKQSLMEQKPLVYAYQVDQTKDIMVGGEAAIAVMYSGDAYDAVRNSEDLDYVIPKEGSNLWFDAMVIPKDAPNYDNAHKFIDFMSRPDIAAQNSDYVGYSTPNVEGKNLLEDDMKNSPIVFPDLSKLNNMEVFVDPKEMVVIYDQIWTDVMAQ